MLRLIVVCPRLFHIGITHSVASILVRNYRMRLSVSPNGGKNNASNCGSCWFLRLRISAVCSRSKENRSQGAVYGAGSRAGRSASCEVRAGSRGNDQDGQHGIVAGEDRG